MKMGVVEDCTHMLAVLGGSVGAEWQGGVVSALRGDSSHARRSKSECLQQSDRSTSGCRLWRE